MFATRPTSAGSSKTSSAWSSVMSRPRAATSPRLIASTKLAATIRGLGIAREVLRGDLVEELLEAVDDLLGVLDLVLELDRRLGDDLFGGEDRRAGAHGQREGVAGTRVDLELAAVDGQGDRGEEGVVAQLGDRDLRAPDLELSEDVDEQVVGHGPRRGRSLQLHEDRRSFRMADPDRQELVAVGGLEQDDRLLADHVEAHAVDDHFLHNCSL